MSCPHCGAESHNIERRNYGRGHGYKRDGQKVPGVTTIIGDALPPKLDSWAARLTAEFVVERLVEKDGHVLADDLLPALAEVNRSSRYPSRWDGRFSRMEMAKILESVRYGVSSAAALKGTQIHGFAERLAAGEEVEVPEEFVGHVDSYLKFREEWQPRDEVLEFVVFSCRHNYCGTGDLIATLVDGDRWGLDIKTGTGIWPDTALQLAAYRFADFVVKDGVEVPMESWDRAGVLWLRADGYDLVPYEAGELEFRMFRHAQQVAWFKQVHAETVKGDALRPPAQQDVA